MQIQEFFYMHPDTVKLDHIVQQFKPVSEFVIALFLSWR
jgi:hypothetical protein